MYSLKNQPKYSHIHHPLTSYRENLNFLKKSREIVDRDLKFNFVNDDLIEFNALSLSCPKVYLVFIIPDISKVAGKRKRNKWTNDQVPRHSGKNLLSAIVFDGDLGRDFWMAKVWLWYSSHARIIKFAHVGSQSRMSLCAVGSVK